jgi:glutamate N-acetyltransferase/amino-acid N-acetyltransferase
MAEKPAVSPLAPKDGFPALPELPGVRFATHQAGIRYKGRTDLLVVEMPAGTQAAGVLTTSKTRSAPVDWCAHALKKGKGRVLVVNAGNANAFTGSRGEGSVARTVGEFLPDERITDALPVVRDKFTSSDWLSAAKAIMTTDTYPKGATRTATIGKTTVTLNGIAKGSGMIAPAMGTMLSYVFTDANIPAEMLQEMLRKGADRSFNSITVDGDTSTSDTLLVFATGTAGNKLPKSASDKALKDFRAALNSLLMDLAHQVVRDGEGATKFVEIQVSGAASNKAARQIGLTIGNSPLVKTAIAGEDANWGRIVAAIGKAGEKADRDRLCIGMGGVLVAENGLAVPGYDETPVAAHMKGTDIVITVDVGVGKGKATVWTCDLTHGYIDINGSYRS